MFEALRNAELGSPSEKKAERKQTEQEKRDAKHEEAENVVIKLGGGEKGATGIFCN